MKKRMLLTTIFVIAFLIVSIPASFAIFNTNVSLTGNATSNGFVTLTYNAPNSACHNMSKRVANGTVITELCTPEILGKDFLGWYTAPSNGTQINEYTQITNQMSDMTLYGRFVDVGLLKTGTEVNDIFETMTGSLGSAEYIKRIYSLNDLPSGVGTRYTISVSNVTPVYAWFNSNDDTIYYYSEAERIYLNPDSSHMFEYMTRIKFLDIDDLCADKVTDMSYMFYNTGFNSISFATDLTEWDVSNVTTMEGMFRDCANDAIYFIIGDLSGWDTRNVTNMSYMFYNTSNQAYTWGPIGILRIYADNVDYMFDLSYTSIATVNLYVTPTYYTSAFRTGGMELVGICNYYNMLYTQKITVNYTSNVDISIIATNGNNGSFGIQLD